MGVVTAGMHHVDFAAEIIPLRRGGEGEPRGLFHRQRIHVGAQHHNRTGLAALQQRDHARVGDTSRDVEAEPAQVPGDKRRGAEFLLAELGMLVDIAPPSDQLVFNLRGAPANFLFEAMTGRLRARHVRTGNLAKEDGSEHGRMQAAGHARPPTQDCSTQSTTSSGAASAAASPSSRASRR